MIVARLLHAGEYFAASLLPGMMVLIHRSNVFHLLVGWLVGFLNCVYTQTFYWKTNEDCQNNEIGSQFALWLLVICRSIICLWNH